MMLKALLMIVLVLAMTPAHSELQIEVTQGADDAVKIAVVPFDWRGRGALPEEIHEIVTADLRLSGRFETLPVSQMLSLPSEASEVYVRDWQLLDMEYVVIGSVREYGPDLAMTFELFDVFKGEVTLRQTVVGSDLDLRDLAHHASDAIYEQLTGIEGAFSTEILYITVTETP